MGTEPAAPQPKVTEWKSYCPLTSVAAGRLHPPVGGYRLASCQRRRECDFGPANTPRFMLLDVATEVCCGVQLLDMATEVCCRVQLLNMATEVVQHEAIGHGYGGVRAGCESVPKLDD